MDNDDPRNTFPLSRRKFLAGFLAFLGGLFVGKLPVSEARNSSLGRRMAHSPKGFEVGPLGDPRRGCSFPVEERPPHFSDL